MLTKPGKNGSTLYDQLAQVEKTTGKWPAEYEPLSPPEGTEHIWQTFWELRDTARMGFSGPERLSFFDLDAWMRVRDLKLPGWFIDMIMAMDMAYMNERFRNSGGGGKAPKKPIRKR